VAIQHSTEAQLTRLSLLPIWVCFLLATTALFRWVVPEKWFRSLIIAGVVFSIMLQSIWFTAWAVLPLLVDIILVWAVFGRQITVSGLRTEK